MSSLIFYTDSTHVFVAVDTLATDVNGTPAYFCQKANHIPHLKMLIAGTGAAGFANEWALQVSTRMVVTGILNLNYHTSSSLQILWEDYLKRYSASSKTTTTVYHFGLREDTGEVCTIAYRSKNTFEPEFLDYGLAVKPQCNILDGDWEDIVPTMMRQQCELQTKIPTDERVYIGGEMITYMLSNSGCSTFKIGEFEDFNQHIKDIFEKFDKE
jgi:hypothetical protein